MVEKPLIRIVCNIEELLSPSYIEEVILSLSNMVRCEHKFYYHKSDFKHKAC
ncbi:MAG: hypothetical protein ACJAUR_001695 [Ulvibacter sp.]|jgi:hypothetical protein